MEPNSEIVQPIYASGSLERGVVQVRNYRTRRQEKYMILMISKQGVFFRKKPPTLNQSDQEWMQYTRRTTKAALALTNWRIPIEARSGQSSYVCRSRTQ